MHKEPVKVETEYQDKLPQRKAGFEAWSKLRPIYFANWMWQEACRREPEKYKMLFPVYHGKRVILT